MSGELFIRFEGDAESASWLRLAEDGAVAASGHGPLSEVKAAAAGYRLVVIIPAEEVLLCRAAVPVQKRRLLAQAVPYALEDQLAADVETLHFAFGQVVNDEVAVAVIDRALMDGWLARLREASLNPYALVAETLLLPWQEGAWQLACFENHCLLRNGEQSGFAMDAANTAVLVQQALAEAEESKPQRLVVHGAAASPLGELELEIEPQPLPDAILPWLASHYDERLAINLLQGSYSRRERLGQYWRPWRVAASLAVALLLLQVGGTIADHQRLSSERVALQEQIETIYRQTFPEARKVVNPKAQMENALKALRGGAGGGLNQLLAAAGKEFQSSPGLTLQRLNFRDGQLDVALTIADLQRLDELKQRLTQGGKLHVEIQSASAQGTVVEARLRIKGQAS
jgi:general secretion pathway protein L